MYFKLFIHQMEFQFQLRYYSSSASLVYSSGLSCESIASFIFSCNPQSSIPLHLWQTVGQISEWYCFLYHGRFINSWSKYCQVENCCIAVLH